MTEERKEEIINDLETVSQGFEPTIEEPEMSMFYLVSNYNAQFDNQEKIGGTWVRENVPKFKDLPY